MRHVDTGSLNTANHVVPLVASASSMLVGHLKDDQRIRNKRLQ